MCVHNPMSISRQQDWLQDNLSGVTAGLVALHSFFNCVPQVTQPAAFMPDITAGPVASHSFFNHVLDVTQPAAFMPDVKWWCLQHITGGHLSFLCATSPAICHLQNKMIIKQ